MQGCAPSADHSASENTADICGNMSHWVLEQVIGEEADVPITCLPRLWANLSTCSFSMKVAGRALTPLSSETVLPRCPRQLPRKLYAPSPHVRLHLSLEMVGGTGASHPGGLHTDAHQAAWGAMAAGGPGVRCMCWLLVQPVCSG